MAPHPLDGALARIRRARENLVVFKAERHRFVEDSGMKPVAEYFHDQSRSSPLGVVIPGRYVLSMPEPIPLHWALLISDVLNDLRTSLDYMAYEISLLEDREGAIEHVRDIQFPIYKDAKGKKKAFKRQMRFFPPRLRHVLHEIHEPMRLGDEFFTSPLWALMELTNFTKHRALHLTAMTVGEIGHKLVSPGGQLTHTRTFSGPCRDGSVIGEFEVHIPPDATREFQQRPLVALDVHFDQAGEGSAAALGYSVRDTLVECLGQVDRIFTLVLSVFDTAGLVMSLPKWQKPPPV